jgi:rRNA pseudouridine-1189 N-methylase Emg1 (Nep1/Mra1 family)
MAKLLIDENVNAEGISLISRFDGTLSTLLNKFIKPKIYLFSSKGKLIENHKEIFINNPSENIVCIIGGFQKSNFSKQVFSLSKNIISISNYTLDAWIVISKIINFYELKHNII